MKPQSRYGNAIRAEIQQAVGWWHFWVDDYVDSAIERGGRNEQDEVPSRPGKIGGAPAQLVGGGAVGPQLLGRHAEGALKLTIGEIQNALCNREINRNQVVRAEGEAAQRGKVGILGPLGTGTVSAGGEVQTAVDPGSIPAPVSIEDGTEVKWMRAPRDVAPNPSAPGQPDQANAPACAPARTSRIGRSSPRRTSSIGRRPWRRGTSRCSHSSATLSLGNVLASSLLNSRS